MLTSISVKNFRSFLETSTVELRPLTIFLGRNSAGKSSITRLFPLLQQSLERGTAAPLLWSSPSIDFGRITDVLSRQRPDVPLELTFRFENHVISSPSLRWASNLSTAKGDPRASIADVTFTAYLNADEHGKTNYDRFQITINKDVVDVRGLTRRPEFLFNGKRFRIPPEWGEVVLGTKRLFPYVGIYRKDQKPTYAEGLATRDEIIDIIQQLIESPVLTIDSPQAASVFGGSSVAPIPFVSREELPGYLRTLGKSRSSNFDNDKINRLSDLLVITYFSSIVESISTFVLPILNNLSYLGPIRASGNRFYRERELSVEKIDDKGENLATYIGALSKQQLNAFNAILSDAFGVVVRSHQTEGHLSIEIGRLGDDVFDNLADVGFGFSQLLPLVAQLHADSRRRDVFMPHKVGDIQVTVVEQPELHLHPAYQANLADLFVAAVQNGHDFGNQPIIILETHSEALISRLGELVALGRIKPSQIAVHFFEKEERSGVSTIRRGEYDKDGMIDNWPLGFFSARNF